ncbi:hypothetical protein MAR_020489 [Mya arenaria]|uniref:Uncharacterized protein n=1 Tax=Mya arenaria TaxID=6604 RepID=A0ABY7E512_MYAAR|nr:hypothetical protein MAR_020489 [Mya arenaria]
MLHGALHSKHITLNSVMEVICYHYRLCCLECPLMTLMIPDTKVLYCTMDDLCLGIECCLTIEVFEILSKTFKAFVRYDPDIPSLTFGFESWSFELTGEELGGDEERIVKTGIKFDFLDGNDIIIKYSIKIRGKNLKVTFGAGICNRDNYEDCFQFFYILKDAIIPYPILHPNGSLSFPKVDWKELFQDGIGDAIKDATENIVETAIDVAVDKFLNMLNIDKELLLSGHVCSRPENLERNDLIFELENRKLSIEGTREQLEERLKNDDLTCSVHGKQVKLPDMNSDTLYYQVQNDCMRIEVCVDIKIPIIEYTKSFTAYLNLDPCNFVITAGFEKWSVEIILFDYAWGKAEKVKLAELIYITFSINKLDDEKVFAVNLGIKFDTIEQDILIDFKVGIPVCNNNFTLLGNLKDLANALGGELNKQAFNLLLQQLGIKDILSEERCVLPEPPTDCAPLFGISNIVPESLKKILRCQLSDDCFGLFCCVDLTFQMPLSSVELSVGFPVWFSIDPCEFIIKAGIAHLEFKEQLLQYNWGAPSTIHIGKSAQSPIEITYSIGKYEDGFILDLALVICIPIDNERFCIPDEGLQILDQEHLPACNLAALTNFSDFSFGEWLKDKGYDITSELSEVGAQALFQQLGLSNFLKSPPCDRRREPYVPSVDSWSNLCPLTFKHMPTLPEQVSCSIPNHCTAIDCCIRIPAIGLSLNAFFNIDMCNYVVTGGIEKHTFHFSLFEYEWGKVETETILNVLRLTYSIKKIDNEKKFIIDLNVAVCLDSSGSCLFESNVLEGSEVPQLGCDFEFDFKNFSATQWLSDNAIGNLLPTDNRWNDVLELLYQITGIDKYFMNPQCSIDLDEDQAELNIQNGWINECPSSSTTLPQVIGALCRLGETCTAFDCCIYVPFMKRNIQIALDIDFCKFEIHGSIESVSLQLTIFDYEWGSSKVETILEMIRLKYKIDKTEKHFIVDLSLHVCMDSNDQCQLDLDILVNEMLPIPICNSDFELSLKNFSLETFKDGIGFSADDILSTAAINVLLKQLNLDNYLLSKSCSLLDKKYLNAVNGWVNECTALKQLPTLPENVVCYIPDFCTGIECCSNIDIIRKSISAHVILNACQYTFSIGIEKLTEDKSLITYKWGTEEHVSLGGIRFHTFRFRLLTHQYTIEDLQSDNTFVMNVKLKVCFENQYCVIDVPLLTNAYLPKPLCNWDTGYALHNYSLVNWLSQHSFNVDGEFLQTYVIEKLLHELGIAKYLRQIQCKIGQTPFVDAWNNDCPMEIQTRVIPSSMACHIKDYCTGIECCIEVPVIKRSLTAYLFLNACDYKLEIGIEDYTLNISLLAYSWGQWDEFNLLGICRIRYRIINLEAEKIYIVDLQMSLCIQSDPCEEVVDILKEAKFPKPGCDWSGDLPSFSLDDIGIDLSLNSLPSYTVDILLQKLGILEYINRKHSCTLSSTKYYPDINGWKNEIDKDIDLAQLPNNLKCNIHGTGTVIDCCLSVPFMRQTFEASIDLNACDFTITLLFEKYQLVISLLDFEWGIPQKLNLKGVFHIQYVVFIFNIRLTH